MEVLSPPTSSVESFSPPLPAMKLEPGPAPALGLPPKDEGGGELDEEINFVDHEYFDSFPPGYRFNPYDDELVEHYLAKKVLGQSVPANKIMEVNLYKYNPEELAEKYRHCGENEWYFFTPRDRKYKHGKRPNRAAGDGYWKATGADKPVRKSNGAKVGYKKALVFYRGKPPKGAKTSWIMHEYRVGEHPAPRRRPDNGADDMRLDDYVLCRIYKKVGNGSLRRTPRQREVLGGNFSPDHDVADHDEPQDATITDQTTVHGAMAVDNRALHPGYSHHLLHGEEDDNLSALTTDYVDQMQMEMHIGDHFERICYPSQQNFTDHDWHWNEDLWGSFHGQFDYDHHRHDRVVVDDHLAGYPRQHHGAGSSALAMSTWDSSAPGLTLDMEACDTKPRSTYM